MRRGRVMLLTLLAFGLPTAALANSVDFDTGTFISGTITGTVKSGFDVTETGNLFTITIDTGTLIKLPQNDCTSGSTCYHFTGGSVTVDKGSSMVFTDSLQGGLTISGNHEVSINATLSPNSMVGSGSAVATATLDFNGNTILAGSSDVSFSTSVPEPSALLSLGTGMIGLLGMMRRKLKLGV